MLQVRGCTRIQGGKATACVLTLLIRQDTPISPAPEHSNLRNSIANKVPITTSWFQAITK